MEDIIMKLKDAEIISFDTDLSGYSGCETCDYGSKYTHECTIMTTNYKIFIEISDMYKYPPLTMSFWIEFFCKNYNELEKLTEEEFIDFLQEKVYLTFNTQLYYTPGITITKR